MRVMLRSVACLLAALAACSSDPTGQTFDSEAALLRSLGNCEVVGRFGDSFPARVVRVEAGDHGLRFVHANQPQEYGPEFGPMRAVFLDHQGEAGVIVVRARSRS